MPHSVALCNPGGTEQQSTYERCQSRRKAAKAKRQEEWSTLQRVEYSARSKQERQRRQSEKENRRDTMLRPSGYKSAPGVFHLARRLLTSSLNQVFLHVGPSGDCWTGSSIYAAKHLQPDYVKSIPIPSHVCTESLLRILEGDATLAQQIYDDERLPPNLIQEEEPPTT